MATPLFDKSARNHFAVLVALIALEDGEKVTEESVDKMLVDARCKIYKNKVVGLKFNSGSRTLSALGGDALERIRDIKKPFAWHNETFGEYKFVHARIDDGHKFVSVVPFALFGFFNSHPLIFVAVVWVLLAVGYLLFLNLVGWGWGNRTPKERLEDDKDQEEYLKKWRDKK